MLHEIMRIGQFMAQSFVHIWPYLLVTIPLAVGVQLSGASRYIKRAFQASPLVSIILATVVGAFSPFCSCGVIPVVASLLISGVPLAPVMSFWIASPSMDPEIFFLSVGTIGWELAVWRLSVTLLLSFGAGLITQLFMSKGLLGQHILRRHRNSPVQSPSEVLKNSWKTLKNKLLTIRPPRFATPAAAAPACTACSASIPRIDHIQPAIHAKTQAAQMAPKPVDDSQGCGCDSAPETFRMRLFKETLSATGMVVKFMALAFFLEGLITLYVPQHWISNALGSANPIAILTAALLGVPAYTTSLTALPMISGLLTQGMNPAAALAFLIAGPTTTLPAMAAVWPLVTRSVFVLYVSFALIGAVIAGYMYTIVRILL